MTKPATTKSTTRMDYGRRIARVVAYIGENLDRDLPLDTLAEIACFSPYHFHRIYRGIAGETAAETVRRLRLHRAAFALAQSQDPIRQIAEQAGYGSVEAFTRAFAADHGQPPAAFRAHQESPTNPTGGAVTMQTVTIKSFNSVRLAALPHCGDYQAIGRRFEELTAWAGAHNLFETPRRWFAIYYDDPESVPTSQLRSDACVELTADMPLGPGMVERRIAPGRVASLVHKGPYAELERVYRALYRDWLPDSGEEADDRPSFEEYLNNPRQVLPSEWLTEVFLPLRG
jgi:AraC family transcriptional regulator